jgi:hypothetical protein
MDLNNQEKFNTIMSFFIGVMISLFLYNLTNKNKIIIVKE